MNLLTGINGRRKSSLLQSLLLLSQTFRKKKTPLQLLINGEWVKLGSFDDLKNRDLGNDTFFIKIKTDDSEKNVILFEYGELQSNERIAELRSLKIDGKDMFVETGEEESGETTHSSKSLDPLDSIKTFSLFYKFHFITADRIGPVEYVRKTDDTIDSMPTGIRGENVINILAYNGDFFLVNKNIVIGEKYDLLTQTKEWLSYILDGTNIEIKKDRISSILSVTLNSKTSSHLYKPANVGFGHSYILPLVVVGLIAKTGDTVIIENPEAHLHPRAQARLTEFFVKIAGTGVQVFTESHSEHILNSMRVCSLKKDFALTNKEMSVIYFDENYKNIPLAIDESGRISNLPDGFFDQQEIDLVQIFNLAK
ncbi:hypothetical protein Barb6_02336 [Bacteroidales bacterium Barb6]|nr:hypothetical protein Barb6_02336 [Bacteroidales bacterium Barb6]